MQEVEVFPIDVDYIVIDNKVTVRIFGQVSNGEKKIFYDDSYSPYCYIEAKKSELLPNLSGLDFVTDIEEVQKTYLGRAITVCKVYTKLPEDVPRLRNLKFRIYDADIPFYKRYMLDKGIGTFSRIKMLVDGDHIKNIISVETANPIINAIAFDIEVFSKKAFPDSKSDPIIAISLFNYKINKVLTWLDAEGENIERLPDEKALLLRFAEIVTQYNPEILVGYNSDNFDLPYIQDRANVLGISLKFNGFPIKTRGTRKVSEINGKMHIDILNFIRNIYSIYNLKTESLDLNSVASEMLGESKGSFVWDDAEKIFSDRKRATDLCTYCLRDSYLTFRLYDNMFSLMAELNKYIGQSLQDVSRMTTGSIVENLIMKELTGRGEVIPNKPSEFEVNERLRRVNVGAFVYQPMPGLYHDIGVVDFRSLYPSIIVSHNICPSTIKIIDGKPSFIERSERKGLIPSVLEIVLNDRVSAKEQLKLDPTNSNLKARVSVLKLIANGFYGYLGFYNARWYCFECAGAVTALGREYVNSVIKAAESAGFKVIYADTDSAFIANITEDKLKQFLQKFNSSLPHPMELEFQGEYEAALFVNLKSKERGAKKKYALVDKNGVLTVKGFQSVRRDWAIIAKETQVNTLKKILVEKNTAAALQYVKQIIDDIKKGFVPLEKMVIFTRLHKAPSSYQQAGRHVMAVKHSGITFSSGDLVKYIIAKGRPDEKVSDRAVLYDIARQNNITYDPDYYINQQILPAVMQILEVVGFSVDDVLGTKSTSLKSFI